MIESPRIHEHLVTPEVAEQWMEKNTSNRRLSLPLVERYARDMGAGKWELNGETVKFDSSGRVIDGQHRLAAIIRSGKTCRLHVATGLPVRRGIVATIDNGRPRSAGDVLRMNGFASHSRMASIARFVLQLESGMMNCGPVGNAEILAEVTENPEAYKQAALHGKHVERVVIVPPYGAFSMQAHARDPVAFAEWHEQFASGANLDRDSAILTLRNHLLQAKSLGRTRVTTFRYDAYCKLCRTWNRWRSGMPLRKITRSKQTKGKVEVI